MLSIPSIISTLATTDSNIMLYEAGIHDTTESICVSGLESGISYTIVIGSGGIFPNHSHIPVLLNRKNIILNHIGHDYEPYYRFSFSIEDTLFHNHAPHHIYYCMDDDTGGESLYCMDTRDYKYGTLSSPQTCHRTIESFGHTHTLTLVRHAGVKDAADISESNPNSATGADPTAP